MYSVTTPPLPAQDRYRAWKILQDKSTQTWPPISLLQAPYLVLPPTGVDQPGLRIGGIWVQNTERGRERSQLCASSHKERMKTFANSPQW